MQVNNIINLAFSASDPVASPNAGKAAGNASAEKKLSSFNDIVAKAAPKDVANTISDTADYTGLEVADLQINDPQGGIIPIPQIYDAAPLIPQIASILPINFERAAGQYIDLSANGGAIDQSTLQSVFAAKLSTSPFQTAMLAAQAPIGLGDVQIGLPLANEIGNSQITDDAAFNSQVAALQNAIAKNAEPQNIDKAVSDLVATAGQVAQVQKPQTVSADDLAAIQALQVDLDAAIQEKIQAKVDDAYSLETKLSDISKSVDPTNSFATLASLSKKIVEDYKDFSSKPIDVNELKFTNKLVGAEHSKLEAQIKHLDAEQFIQRSPIEQVKVKISQGIEMGMDRISIKLHPAELGKVDVDLDLDKDGKTHVRIVADRSETLDFLRRDSGELQKALRELGVYNDDSNLQFSLNQNGQNGENGTDNQAKNSNYKAASDEYSALTQPLSEAEVNLVINHGGLNIMV